jgi:hypothetical protein
MKQPNSIFMQEVKSKVAFATDTWTTRQMVYTFACTMGSFIDEDWKLITYVVDFTPLKNKQHKRLYAGKAFVDGTRERGALNKMCHTYFLFYPSSILSNKFTSQHLQSTMLLSIMSLSRWLDELF